MSGDSSPSEMADFSVEVPSSEMADFPPTSCGHADAEKVMPPRSIGAQFAACPAVAGHAKKKNKKK